MTHKCWARNIPLMSFCNSNQRQEAGGRQGQRIRETLLPTNHQDSFFFWRQSLTYVSWLQSPYTAQDDLELQSNQRLETRTTTMHTLSGAGNGAQSQTTTLPTESHPQPSHWTLLLKGSIKPQLSPQKPRPLSMEPLTHGEAQWQPSRV